MDTKRVTPSQTIGPFFHPGLGWAVTRDPSLLADDEWIVWGTVTDANGEGVSDALLEIWQPRLPRSSGASVAPGFERIYTDKAGRFAFRVRRTANALTVVHVTLFARGLLGLLRTRLYLGASSEQFEQRPELQHVPKDRLQTLIPTSVDPERRTLDWPIRLQGDGETVFFELV